MISGKPQKAGGIRRMEKWAEVVDKQRPLPYNRQAKQQ